MSITRRRKIRIETHEITVIRLGANTSLNSLEASAEAQDLPERDDGREDVEEADQVGHLLIDGTKPQ